VLKEQTLDLCQPVKRTFFVVLHLYEMGPSCCIRFISNIITLVIELFEE
jgi:hypothetical protein